MKILIVGGGIAGCTLAFFLKEYGFMPTIVEKAEKFERIGYLLALRETGLSLLKKMKLYEKVARFEIPFTKSIWYDEKGRLIRSFDVDAVLREYAGMAINRADLHRGLYDAVKEDASFQFGREILHLEQTGEKVVVTFLDSIKEEFDIVIAADGISSSVRKMVFGEGHTQFLKSSFFAFIAPNRVDRAFIKEREGLNIRGRNFFISFGKYSTDESELGGYVMYRSNRFVPVPQEKRREYMISHFGSYDVRFLQILKSLTNDDFIYHGDLSQVTIPIWRRGRVCLLGDAAYCLTLASGLGASMAMAGAFTLAQSLATEKNYTEAFANYEASLRSEIEKLQTFGRRTAEFIVGETILPYELMNFFLRFTPQGLIAKALLHNSKTRVIFS